jgi:hypothetical protein
MEESRGVGPMVGQIFREKGGADELLSGEGNIGIGAGQVGKGSNKIEKGMLGDESKEAKKVVGVRAEAIHSGIELGLNSGDGSGALGDEGKFLSF